MIYRHLNNAEKNINWGQKKKKTLSMYLLLMKVGLSNSKSGSQWLIGHAPSKM